MLEGWELKSIRAGQVQLADSFVTIRQGEAFLHNARIAPLSSASTHVQTEPDRTRKMLLKVKEISEIYRATQEKGQSCVVLAMYWKQQWVKVEIALATGKRQFDKRRAIKERDLRRQLE